MVIMKQHKIYTGFGVDPTAMLTSKSRSVVARP